MGDTFVISGLTAKRAELAGAVEDLEKRLRDARADLAHLDATLCLFDPAAKPKVIKAKRRNKRLAIFASGEIARRCRDAARVAGVEGVTADAIVRKAMLDKSYNAEDDKAYADLVLRFMGTLYRLGKDGVLAQVGTGTTARWKTIG
jgi:hypothetical protein